MIWRFFIYVALALLLIGGALSWLISWTFAWDFVKSLMVPLAGSFAGAWATIEVFREQIAKTNENQVEELNRTIQAEKQRQDRQAAANISNFVWLLDSVLKFATKQSADYLETSNQVDNDLLSAHRLINRASTSITRIFTLKQDDIFASFIHKALDTTENREHVANIYNQLDYIKTSLKSNRLKYKEHIKTYINLTKDYKGIIDNIRETFTAALDIPGNPPTEFGSFADHVLTFYRTSFEDSDKSLDIEWHHEEFLTPLLTDLNTNFKNDKVQNINLQISKASKIIGSIKFNSRSISADLKEAIKMLNESIEKLQTETDYVKAVLMTT